MITGTTVTLRWTLSTDIDVLVGGTVIFRHSSLLAGATWNNSISLPTVVAGNSTSATLPLQIGTYLVKFVDSAGNQSTNAMSIVVEAAIDILDPQVAVTLAQHPAFSGIKTNMLVVSNELQLDNSTTGAYEFDNYGDLGSVQVGRILVKNVIQAYLISDNIDDRNTLIDNWVEFDNLSVDVNPEIYISTTNDDPAGSPIWSPWIKFSPADYQARAFKFKIEITTDNLQNQIKISELVATISTI